MTRAAREATVQVVSKATVCPGDDIGGINGGVMSERDGSERFPAVPAGLSLNTRRELFMP